MAEKLTLTDIADRIEGILGDNTPESEKNTAFTYLAEDIRKQVKEGASFFNAVSRIIRRDKELFVEMLGKKAMCVNCGAAEDLVTEPKHVGGQGDVSMTECRDQVECAHQWNLQHRAELGNAAFEACETAYYEQIKAREKANET